MHRVPLCMCFVILKIRSSVAKNVHSPAGTNEIDSVGWFHLFLVYLFFIFHIFMSSIKKIRVHESNAACDRIRHANICYVLTVFHVLRTMYLVYPTIKGAMALVFNHSLDVFKSDEKLSNVIKAFFRHRRRLVVLVMTMTGQHRVLIVSYRTHRRLIKNRMSESVHRMAK